MYTLVLYLHSYNRWLVLLGGALALWTSYRGWLGGGAWGPGERRASQAFRGLLDLQVLIGLLLYALSPIVRTALGDLGAAMSIRELRFFSVEHITGMVVALGLVHIGAARVKRASTDALKLRHAAIWQTLAALSILVSLPWWRPLLRS
jgi:hypothetical protein